MTTIIEGSGELMWETEIEHEQALRRLKSVRLVRQRNPKPRRLAWRVVDGYDLEIMFGHDQYILDALPPGTRSGYPKRFSNREGGGAIFVVDLYKADPGIDLADVQRRVEELTWGEPVF